MKRNADFIASLIRKYGQDSDPDDEGRTFDRNTLRRLRVMEDFQGSWDQMALKIADRFRETIGLMRALESAVAQGVTDPAALAALCRAVRADYAMLVGEFYAFEFRKEPGLELDLCSFPVHDRLLA